VPSRRQPDCRGGRSTGMSGWRSFWMRRAAAPLDEAGRAHRAGGRSAAEQGSTEPRQPSKRYFRLTIPPDRENEPMDYRIRVPKDHETVPLDRSANIPMDHRSRLPLDRPASSPLDHPLSLPLNDASSMPMDPSGVPMDYPCPIPTDHPSSIPPLDRKLDPVDYPVPIPVDRSPSAPVGRNPGPMDQGLGNPIGRKNDPMGTGGENSDFRDDALTWKAPDWVATNLHISSERPADVLALIQHFATEHRYYPPPIDVRRMRRRMGFTQTQFARRFGVPVATLRHWERGDRKPRLSARALLHLIDKFPQLVLRGLRPRPATASSAASGSTPSPRGRTRRE